MSTFARFFSQTLIVFLSFFVILATPAAAQTTPWLESNCVGTAGSATRTDASDVATIQGFGCLIANVFSVAISAIGFAGFVMLVVGSFRLLLSGGNAKGTEDAQKTMTFAAVGLVVALSAFIILGLVARFTGVGTIMRFIIPTSDSGLDGEFEIEEPALPAIVDPRPPEEFPAIVDPRPI